MVPENSLFFFPTSVKWASYIDDLTLTWEELPLLQNSLPALLEHLLGRGWAVNPQKIQGSDTAIKFFRVIHSDECFPRNFINKVQVYPSPQNGQAFQGFGGFVGLLYSTWHSASVPYSAW